MKTVLIVDDSAFMRRLMREAVTRNGYDVIGEAGNGAVGVAKYKELKPDIVTMDITMEGMSGIEALKEIKRFDPEANIIMVSSMSQEVFVRESIVNGAKGFIVKPFEEIQIIKAFSKLD